MHVRVEFYGIPRLAAGVDHCRLEMAAPHSTLAELLGQLARQFPRLAGSCFPEGDLAPECLVSLDGRRFVRDPAVRIHAGQSLLILSSDAGG
jgi:hypothetical protein